VLTFNAERTCRKVLSRIPSCLSRFDVEILLIDDASRDDTFDIVVEYQRAGHSPFPLTVLANPVNQGYGGNQKIGYFYAIEKGFDFVALLHGDGQYPPEKLPEMMDTLLQKDADAVFGSRFMERLAALRGGMPLYKFLGNRVLSTFQNLLLGQHHKGCVVTGIDSDFPGAGEGLDAFLAHDLSSGSLPIALDDFSHILLLDVVEHMADPEEFVSRLKLACSAKGAQQLIVTTGNVAFIVVRLMLALGAFNYGKRGILDLTHKRLFTFRTIRRLFEESGFAVEEVRGIPVPFPLALGDGRPARGLLGLNRLLIRLSRSLFSFQILLRARPLPSLPSLLESAIYESRVRSETRTRGDQATGLKAQGDRETRDGPGQTTLPSH